MLLAMLTPLTRSSQTTKTLTAGPTLETASTDGTDRLHPSHDRYHEQHRQTFYKQTTMKKTTYTIQFWHGGEAVWKNVGTRTDIATLDEAKDFKKAQVEMCGGCVDFRIVEIR